MQTTMDFEKLATPKNQLSAVLKMLIENDTLSEQETVYNGFRARISNLRLKYGLDVRYTEVSFKNMFDHKSTYRKHYLLTIDREKAVEIYNRINH